MSNRDILPGSFDHHRSSLGHARPPWCWRREPQSGRALRRPARHMARGIERAALSAGRCTGQIYSKCHRILRSFAADERTALGAVHDLHPSSLPTSPRLVSQESGSLLEATTMRRRSGTRWRLWLALLATLVLTPCVEASSDKTSPSVPTGLAASAVSCSQINLSWNASTDTGGSGLNGYNVYVWRNSTWTFLKQVLASASSTSNTGLSASTLYYYAVAAVDGAGNTSALSAQASRATPTCTATTTTTTLPAGGACSSPTIIPSQGGTFSGVTSGSSTLAGTCGSTGTSPERVFKWTPAVSGVATIQTCGAGTNFDTALYLRSGSCSSGGEVACNDDACANASGLVRASRVTPTVTAGQTYYIVVDGYGGTQGTFALTVTAPGSVTSTTAIASTTTSTTRATTTTTLLCASPPPPSGLSTTTMSCQEVDLRWTLSSGTVSGYKVYRKRTTDASYTTLTQLGATLAFPVRDTTASGSSTYSYGLTAFNQGGSSAMATALV